MVAKNQKKSFITSTLITIVIVALLILSGPLASALMVTLSADKTQVRAGDAGAAGNITFTTWVNLSDPDKYVPIQRIYLNLSGSLPRSFSFDTSGGSISGTGFNGELTVTTAGFGSSNFGYGSGYGYGYNTGVYYDFGYGYGYGYGSGAGSAPLNVSYTITLNTTNMYDGNYTATTNVYAAGSSASQGFASTTSVAFEILPRLITATIPAAGGDGGGSGGGGIVTSEPYTNIEKAERYDKNLIANTPVTYTFKVPELGVYEIAVTGKESENDVALRVEALKGTSKLVTVQAPGIVYKNVNIWAGTKRIKEALIRFKVENSWIGSNSLATSDVKMVKWDGSKWAQLETMEKTKDSAFTYFEAKTDTFSVFAITGLKGGVIVPTATPAGVVTETPLKPTVTPTAPTAAPTKKVPGFEGIVAIVAIALLVASLNNDRKRR